MSGTCHQAWLPVRRREARQVVARPCYLSAGSRRSFHQGAEGKKGEEARPFPVLCTYEICGAVVRSPLMRASYYRSCINEDPLVELFGSVPGTYSRLWPCVRPQAAVRHASTVQRPPPSCVGVFVTFSGLSAEPRQSVQARENKTTKKVNPRRRTIPAWLLFRSLAFGCVLSRLGSQRGNRPSRGCSCNVWTLPCSACGRREIDSSLRMQPVGLRLMGKEAWDVTNDWR
ncbi:hypothetical protein V8C44DRAFT_48994 [Trichoderma aethiopicum]